jgi:hypothetical protein
MAISDARMFALSPGRDRLCCHRPSTDGPAMLRYGYFHDLNNGPKLLVWGSPEAMGRFYEALAQVAAGEGPQLFTDIPGCQPVDGTSVQFETVGEAEGIERDPVEPDLFHWRVDAETWCWFQEQVEKLMHCSPTHPGHQYLECVAGGDIVVMVSCCEYPDDFKP